MSSIKDYVEDARHDINSGLQSLQLAINSLEDGLEEGDVVPDNLTRLETVAEEVEYAVQDLDRLLKLYLR